jgi:hypothetical protein
METDLNSIFGEFLKCGSNQTKNLYYINFNELYLLRLKDSRVNFIFSKAKVAMLYNNSYVSKKISMDMY